MEYLRQTTDSARLSDVFDLPLSLRDKQVEVIILPVESKAAEIPRHKIQLGFLDLPPLPDSFFDPLPEEELQAWGL